MRSSRRRPTWAEQALSLLLALLFVGGHAVEAYGIRDCSHHHPEPRAPASEPGLYRAAGGSDAPSDEGVRFCRCLGACHAAAVTPLPTLAAVPASLLLSPVLTLGSPPATTHHPGRAEYLLPYANAPPPS